jgi:hypothetical protein
MEFALLVFPHGKSHLPSFLNSVTDGNVQPISDEFLQWFIKNSYCEFVETERLEDGKYVNFLPNGDTEEAINKYPLINQRIGFKEGVKWQQERSYNEDEIKTIINDIVEKHCTYFSQGIKEGIKLEWLKTLKRNNGKKNK